MPLIRAETLAGSPLVECRGVAANKEQLLAEIEDIIRTMPPMSQIQDSAMENMAWFGRASAAIENWDTGKGALATLYISEITHSSRPISYAGVQRVIILLNQARHSLLSQIPGAGSLALSTWAISCRFHRLGQPLTC